MSRLAEIAAPARLGVGFRWLLASSWVTNLGDGIALAAGPLLVASLTHDAFLVALAATVQWLPPLLFGLMAGALTDRLDRRLIVVTVDLARAAGPRRADARRRDRLRLDRRWCSWRCSC